MYEYIGIRVCGDICSGWNQWRNLSEGDRSLFKVLADDINSMIPRVKTLHVLPFEEGTALVSIIYTIV